MQFKLCLILLCSSAFLSIESCRTVDKNDGLKSASIIEGQTCPWRTTKDLIVPPEVFGQSDPEKILTKEEIGQDLACLSDLFKKQYAAVEYYKNLDPNISLIDRVIQFAANATPISNYNLMPILFDTIHKDAYDGHLNYWLLGDPGKSRTPIAKRSQKLVPNIIFAKTAEVPSGGTSLTVTAATGVTSSYLVSGCDGMTLRQATNGTKKMSLFVGSFPLSATGVAVTCHPFDTSAANIVLTAIPWQLSTDLNHSKRVTWEEKANGILYVRFWEFGQRDQQGHWSQDQEQLLDLLSSKYADRKLLLDFRSTQTGDSTYGSMIARTLYSKQKPPQLNPKGRQKLSLYTRAGQVSMMNRAIQDPNVFGPSSQTVADNTRTRDNVQILLSRLESKGFTLDTLEVNETGNSSALIELRDKDYSMPIVVLTNNECGSSCGMALAALRDHPKVQFVGTNSSGNLHFMSPGTFMLPNSRIKVELSPNSFSYAPEFPDAIGFVPDLYVIAQDPVTVALNYLSAL